MANSFSIIPNLLPKDDPRYKRWRKSLKKRPAPWNKGHTKESHPSVEKIARTFRREKIDNFKNWRREARRLGILQKEYSALDKNGDLAELMGVVLGDGYIAKFPRTESLTILSNSNNIGFIKRYSNLVKRIFRKEPNIFKRKKSNCVEIEMYQKEISKRLRIPTGPKKDLKVGIPGWISQNRNYLKRYLRGLYEAEGSFCVHKPTYTYKLLFANRNESLLNNVYQGLKNLGLHPHRSKYLVQISKREEVYKAKSLLNFRKY